MDEGSYEFDPCSIDGSDEFEGPATLDEWYPHHNKNKIVQSKWRKEAIGNNFNQQPGIDDLYKIHTYLKKRISDAQIMQIFGIAAETLIAIKKGKYDPVDGISLDNQSKIYKEFIQLEDKIDKLLRGINYIADILFIDKKDKADFKKSMKKPKKSKPSKKFLEEEICEQNDDYSGEEE